MVGKTNKQTKPRQERTIQAPSNEAKGRVSPRGRTSDSSSSWLQGKETTKDCDLPETWFGSRGSGQGEPPKKDRGEPQSSVLGGGAPILGFCQVGEQTCSHDQIWSQLRTDQFHLVKGRLPRVTFCFFKNCTSLYFNPKIHK